MAKLWTILKAIWLVVWTNRDLIEKHIEWIRAEKAKQNTQTDTDTKTDTKIIDTYDESKNL